MLQRVGVHVLLIAILTIPAVSHAQWPANGLAVSSATGSQTAPVAVSDGSGGAIIAWTDQRAGSIDIYARRVASYGAAVWMADGVPLCTAAFDQTAPAIVSDGAGGAIVVWVDLRNGSNRDIYAQRVDAFGVPQWTTNGVAVCSVTNNQYAPAIVSDGSGGAIVAWYDFRSLHYDIYAQRIDGGGTPLWTPGGVGLCTKASNQNSPVITSDDASGAIVAWIDSRNTNADIYARRVDSAGVPQWTTDGVAVCTDVSAQVAPVIARDGSGGAVVVWQDQRSGAYDIYAQRLDATGAGQWTANGVSVCNATLDQIAPRMIGDGVGGAIIAWQDFRTGAYDVYTQRLNGSGAAQWTANGVALCTATANQTEPSIVPDGSAGAIVAWRDTRGGGADIYAQHVSGGGSVQWTTNGIAMCAATADQIAPVAVSDLASGTVVAWQDARGANTDIYAMRVNAGGGIPTAVRASPTPAFTMGAAYPNPFSASTWIDGVVTARGDITVALFDVSGRRVAIRKMDAREAGAVRIRIDDRDDRGWPLPSGVYFCRVTAAGTTQTQKLVIVR
jgi:hypothetical protein